MLEWGQACWSGAVGGGAPSSAQIADSLIEKGKAEIDANRLLYSYIHASAPVHV